MEKNVILGLILAQILGFTSTTILAKNFAQTKEIP